MTVFNKRTERPDNYNPFYMTVGEGGYSKCILGEPTYIDADVLSNCVGYACGRFNELIGVMQYHYLNCDAKDFISRVNSHYPHLVVSSVPRLGAILVLNGTYGHVAVVEEVNDDYIVTSESSYGGVPFELVKRYADKGYARDGNTSNFLGFIHNPINFTNEEEQEEMQKKFEVCCNKTFNVRVRPDETSPIVETTTNEYVSVYNVVDSDIESNYVWYELDNGYIAVIPQYQQIRATGSETTLDYQKGRLDAMNEISSYVNELIEKEKGQ